MKIKGIIFDLDGTIYFGKNLATKAKEVLELCNKKFDNFYKLI